MNKNEVKPSLEEAEATVPPGWKVVGYGNPYRPLFPNLEPRFVYHVEGGWFMVQHTAGVFPNKIYAVQA